MSNKKKNKDKSKKEKNDLILLVGDVLDEKYKKLTEEIFLMQEEVKREQRKENKRAYKMMKKHNTMYLPSKARLCSATSCLCLHLFPIFCFPDRGLELLGLSFLGVGAGLMNTRGSNVIIFPIEPSFSS